MTLWQLWHPCRPGHERCAVDGVECECERVEQERMAEPCECLACGRMHRKLGQPPWALSHEDACRLSRLFNERANLSLVQDQKINEWLKLVIARSLQDAG